jgi:hypothetical protein
MADQIALSYATLTAPVHRDLGACCRKSRPCGIGYMCVCVRERVCVSLCDRLFLRVLFVFVLIYASTCAHGSIQWQAAIGAWNADVPTNV